MNGKGDCPRPMEIGYEEYTRRWVRAFEERVRQLQQQGATANGEKEEKAQDQE